MSNHSLSEFERWCVSKALEEDLGSGDVTSAATIPDRLLGVGRFRAKSDLVLCGLPYAHQVFVTLNVVEGWRAFREDGDRLKAGDIFAEITGPMRILLAGERLALNFLQQLGGVATLTAAFADRVGHTRARVTDTRKTVPLWRRAQKYAVRCGGGENHRTGLFDAVLIKDNHIDAVGGIAMAVEAAKRAAPPGAPIIAEVRRLDEIELAIAAGATRLLLDNMTADELRASVVQVAGRALTEASGGVSLEHVAKIAESGVDLISIGALTHSAPSADIHFKIEALR